MHEFILSAVLIICIAEVSSRRFPRRKTITEGETINIEEAPYMASLIDNRKNSESYNEPFCGAAIIGNKWILTAAHCIKDYKTNELKVRTGATKRYNDGELHDIEKLIVHPDYEVKHYTMGGDIGIVELTKPIKFDQKQRPIHLADHYEPQIGDPLKVSGFGREHIHEEDKKTMQIKSVNLPVVDFLKCKQDYYFDYLRREEVICAGNSPASTCRGDSGGPVVAKNKLVGIVSSGYLCDTSRVPAVFTSVKNYKSWIYKHSACLKKQTSNDDILDAGGSGDSTSSASTSRAGSSRDHRYDI